jgi:hypothetical protein
MLINRQASTQRNISHGTAGITWANNGEFICVMSLDDDTLLPILRKLWASVVRSVQGPADFLCQKVWPWVCVPKELD